MIYLDYAAHTPASKEVLDAFYESESEFIGNPNSNHKLGDLAKKRLEEATKHIKKMLNLREQEVIFTSGATESNNLAIKGIAKEQSKVGKHIITTYLEHSSVTGSILELQNQGFEIDFVNINADGMVDLEHLKELLREDTILVSICAVDSEVGTLQPIEEIENLISLYSNCFFHVDATQAVGKVSNDFSNVDLVTFSAHKFFGISGIGALIRKKNVILSPLIHGGISTTVYRSGTPTLSLIVSMEKALSNIVQNSDENLSCVKILNHKIKTELQKYQNVWLNTPKNCSPYIINISLKGMKSIEFQRELENLDIYVSTKSACCAINAPSRPVYAITKDRKRALSTLRISLSHKTTSEEVAIFLDCFSKCYEKLMKG